MNGNKIFLTLAAFVLAALRARARERAAGQRIAAAWVCEDPDTGHIIDNNIPD
jgi:hypothetical protein